MPLFTIIVFLAIAVGVGTMLSPIWPTRQPRIALAAVLITGLVAGGAVFWATAFGWQNLVVDYILFGLVSGVVLGGTMAQAGRQHGSDEVLEDRDVGWPSMVDMAVLAMVGLAFALPAVLTIVPAGTGAQATAVHTLAIQRSGDFASLAPFLPDVTVADPPAMQTLSAYLANQLRQPIPTILFGLAAAFGLLALWLAYDAGTEMRDKHLGRALGLALLAGQGLMGLYLNGHFTAMLGLLFALAAVIYVDRYRQHGYPMDLIGAGLMIGATVLAERSASLVLIGATLLWLLGMWLWPAAQRPGVRRWLMLLGGAFAIAGAALAPWFLQYAAAVAPEFLQFRPELANLGSMLTLHNAPIVALAALGAWAGLRDPHLRPITLFMLGWLVLVVDFAATGLLVALVPLLGRLADPLMVAWVGPVIPYTLLGGIALAWLWARVPAAWGDRAIRQNLWLVAGGGALVLMAVAGLTQVHLVDAATSAADRDAAAWMAANTDEASTRVLVPDHAAGVWFGALAGRDARPVPVSVYTEPFAQAQPLGAEVPPLADLLADGITHLFIPQGHAFTDDATYSEVAYEADGARIEAVVAAEAP
jgi:hypothetical protein